MDLISKPTKKPAAPDLILRLHQTYLDRSGTRERCIGKLLLDRQMCGALEREIAIAADRFPFFCTDWISYYTDPNHTVRSDCGRICATRAITATGKLFWLCASQTSGDCYHASHVDPFAAMEDSSAVWSERREILRAWGQVEQFASDLIWGRQRAQVTRSDIDSSPLCDLGVGGFLRAFGLEHRTHLSGRSVALLMKLEPQVGFVLHQTRQRIMAST